MNNIVETENRPKCPVCNKNGFIKYKNQRPTLNYNKVDNKWDTLGCPGPDCFTHWLSPTPKVSEIYKLYQDYSTHISYNEDFKINFYKKSFIKSFLDRSRNILYYKKYNGKKVDRKWYDLFSYVFLKLHKGWVGDQEANIFYLPFNGGKALDLGCGNGSTMLRFIEMGWDIQGVDFDIKATEEAKRKGLNVVCGGLLDLEVKENSYDAIIMNHVIEHLPNHLEILRKCKKILKKGGKLVILTPNSSSIGHLLFKEYWRGLEVPQHLQVFSFISLRETLKSIGFSEVQMVPSMQGALYILRSSYEIFKYGKCDFREYNSLLYKIFKHFSWFILGQFYSIFKNKSEVVGAIITNK